MPTLNPNTTVLVRSYNNYLGMALLFAGQEPLYHPPHRNFYELFSGDRRVG
jgi:hypothetical protein